MTNNKMIVKGYIWTGDPDLPIADYFYVEGGRILNVGFDLHGKLLTLDDVVSYLEDLPKLDHFKDDTPLNHLAIPSILASSPTFNQVKVDDEYQQLVQNISPFIRQKLMQNG